LPLLQGPVSQGLRFSSADFRRIPADISWSARRQVHHWAMTGWSLTDLFGWGYSDATLEEPWPSCIMTGGVTLAEFIVSLRKVDTTSRFFNSSRHTLCTASSSWYSRYPAAESDSLWVAFADEFMWNTCIATAGASRFHETTWSKTMQSKEDGELLIFAPWGLSKTWSKGVGHATAAVLRSPGFTVNRRAKAMQKTEPSFVLGLVHVPWNRDFNKFEHDSTINKCEEIWQFVGIPALCQGNII
jgi:hypothetical protein